MEEPINPAAGRTFKQFKPVITAMLGLVSIVVFIGVNLQGKADNWDAYRNWGAPSVIDIFEGDYWGLLTSNFLHVEIWHIAFNLYWLWVFGKKIEFETRKAFYVLLILSSAWVSSLAQLAFSDSTGIGLSGIVYALFGFLFVKSKTDEGYKNYLDRRTVYLFLFWLLLCVILTQTGTWTVGNAAHIGGLFWGMLLAYTSKFGPSVCWATGIVYLAVWPLLIFYSPFSTSWLSCQAHELHKAQKPDAAIKVYKEILQRDADNEMAKENLKQLEVYQLQVKAMKLHTQQKYNEARALYSQILSIDKDNAWAKENLKQLEVYQLQVKALELHTQQKYNEARALYQQILNIDKGNAWAKENLSRLPLQ